MINVNDCDWDTPSSVAVTETVSVIPPSGGLAVAVAENVAVDDPAGTFTEAGTVNAELLAETDAVTPPAGARAERVRLQVEEAPASSVVASHANAEMSTGASRVKVADWEAPFSVAVMVADWVVVRMPAVTVKVVEVPLAGTVTDAGTVSAALLVESPTAVLAGAGWFRVTVQVLASPEFTLAGLQAKVESSTGATRVNVVVWTVPFKAAVTVALWFAGMAPAVAMKLAELAPAGTVTDVGTVSRALLSDSVTAAPEDAAWFKPTVQVVDAPEASLPGLQLNDVKPSGTTVVIVPPAAVTGSALADGVAPKAFVMPIEVAVVLGEIVAVTTATTPFWMMFTFSPVKRQVYVPGLPAHDRDLPAAVAAAPALSLMATTSAGE